MLTNGQTLISQRESLGTPQEGSQESVSNRIVTLRKERSLTLQECAALTGVSTSTLSKIERKELSPTVSTLQKIASGLGVEIVDLLTQKLHTAGPGRRSVSRAGEGKEHISLSCNNYLLCSDLLGKRMIPVRTRVIARSVDDYPVWAQSDTEIFLFVVSGRMVLHSRIYEPLELGVGDSVYYDATSPHCWTSAGDTDAEVIWLMMA